MNKTLYLNPLYAFLFIMIFFFTSCDFGSLEEEEDDISADLTGEYAAQVLGETFFGNVNMNVSKNTNTSVTVSLIDAGYPEITVELARLTNGNIGMIIAEQFSGNFTITGQLIEDSEFNGVYVFESSDDVEQFLLFPIIETNGIIDSVTISGSLGRVDGSSHCFNGTLDGDEEGIDCGGSCIACEDDSSSPFTFTKSWGSLGTQDNQLNAARKIAATDEFLFINDVGNSKIKKFDHDGNFLAALDFSNPFYVFEERLYVVSDTNNTYLHKFDLNFNLVESFNFNSPIPSGDDISGNESRALITLTGTEEPFLTSLDFINLTQNSFGVLGTGDLSFQWNGSFNVVFENGNNEIPASYFVTDGGNFRVQELDEDFTYVSEFTTNDAGRGVLNSPSAIDASQEYIAITNGNNSGDQIDFYDRQTNEFLFTHQVGDFFQKSVSFNGDNMFVLVDVPSIEVRIYNK